MKFTSATIVFVLLNPLADGFGIGHVAQRRSGLILTNEDLLSSVGPLKSAASDEERMKAIMAEEAMNPANMKASAERMQSMKPEDMDSLLEEMANMSPTQLAQLKAMGMDPELMKTSMKMMRDNPSMLASAAKMMENMTPEQMLEKSRAAQEAMSKMSPEQVAQAAKATAELSPDQVIVATDFLVKSTVITSTSNNDSSGTSTSDAKAELGGQIGNAADPDVIDSMFRVAELMSQPPTGGVTFHAFASLPPITLLSGEREQDLSKKELKECWADGSLGSTRVDRQGFERVWNEVREYFEDDIMEEARKTSIARSRGAATASTTTTSVVPSTVMPSSTPTVGAAISPDQLSEQVKKMSDTDMDFMLDQMNNMTAEQAARMKAMGVDPAMMQKTANMMKNNPLMKKAATAMMKNMSPEQMMKASQQAQQQMAGMSKEDLERTMDAIAKGEK